MQTLVCRPGVLLPDSKPDRFFRECDCPPWVERCAHIGPTAIVSLGDKSLVRGDVRHAHCIGDGWSKRYSVDQTTLAVDCGFCGRPNSGARDGAVDFYETYDEALAAFYAAEEALLRGGA